MNFNMIVQRLTQDNLATEALYRLHKLEYHITCSKWTMSAKAISFVIIFFVMYISI